MELKLCQSCSMPLEEAVFGTNQDGSKNSDYCVYCFKDGKFTDDCKTLEEFTEYSMQFAEQAGMTPDEMREHCKKVLPLLKRWQCNCSEECDCGSNCTCSSNECSCQEEQ